MAGYIRLQEPITITSDQVQDRMGAADISAYSNVLVKITVFVADWNGTLSIEQAMTNDEGAFDPSNISISLASVGRTTLVLQNPERIVRWAASQISGSASFMIEILGRGD